MAYEITIQPSGHKYRAPEGVTILQAALDAGVILPYGCRDGACSSCKGKVLSGEIDYGHAQNSALPAEERAAGMALFCCALPRSDVVIECREVTALGDIPVRILPARVQKLERLAPDVMAMFLKLPVNERLQFIAGQYVEILLRDGKRRAFSLASAPHDDDLLQLHVRLVPGGQFTEHVFGAMKERDILRFSGPQGTFFLREDSARPILLVAGGTGFAPIKSIIEHALHNRIPRPMTLYWGARDRPGLYLPELPRQWAAEHSRFRYVPVLSEEMPEEPEAGDAYRSGLVHRAVLADVSDLSEYEAYVCGSPQMIDAARRDFLAQGLPAEHFFADAFSFAADVGAVA